MTSPFENSLMGGVFFEPSIMVQEHKKRIKITFGDIQFLIPHSFG
jgi:hypothetical protein